MSNITAGQVVEKLREVLNVASALDPHIALASAGIDALTSLFGKTGELNTMMDKAYAETAETAPDVAQEISQFYTDKGDALEKSFRDHPGEG